MYPVTDIKAVCYDIILGSKVPGTFLGVKAAGA